MSKITRAKKCINSANEQEENLSGSSGLVIVEEPTAEEKIDEAEKAQEWKEMQAKIKDLEIKLNEMQEKAT